MESEDAPVGRPRASCGHKQYRATRVGSVLPE
jgi:hypothetical protein